MAARECGWLDLDAALELVLLYAQEAPGKFEPAARRWLLRLGDETVAGTREIALAAGALAAIGGPAEKIAVTALRGLARLPRRRSVLELQRAARG